MVRHLILFLCWVTLSSGAQDISFGKPRRLPAYISSHCEEISPLLSPDKKKLFFARSFCSENIGGKLAGSDIWMSDFSMLTSNWSKPTPAGNSFNDKTNNALVGISSDGGTIYKLNTSSNKKTQGIYFSKRINNSWTPPELIPLSFLDTEGFLGLYVSPDFNVILISMENKEGKGQEDLHVSFKDASGKWSEPRNLGTTINTEGFEISPFLSVNNKRLYFTSSGHWGLGNGDIFYSDRLDETWEKWSPPINLGSQINSKKFDAYFSIYDSVAYFSSNRESQYSDLYVVQVKNAEDSIQQQIKRIVAEARTILVDLGDDTTDSLTINFRSVFIEFDGNSVQISSTVLNQLNPAVECIKKLQSNRVVIVGYSSGAESQDEKLCYKRLEAIKNYVREISSPDLPVELEMKRLGKQESVSRNGMVEVRY